MLRVLDERGFDAGPCGSVWEWSSELLRAGTTRPLDDCIEVKPRTYSWRVLQGVHLATGAGHLSEVNR